MDADRSRTRRRGERLCRGCLPGWCSFPRWSGMKREVGASVQKKAGVLAILSDRFAISAAMVTGFTHTHAWKARCPSDRELVSRSHHGPPSQGFLATEWSGPAFLGRRSPLPFPSHHTHAAADAFAAFGTIQLKDGYTSGGRPEKARIS